MKKFGFTLAEVLITLGIIGVVAAMTMPTLLTKINEKIMVNKLKKFYSTMAQAVKLNMEQNPGDFYTTDRFLDTFTIKTICTGNDTSCAPSIYRYPSGGLMRDWGINDSKRNGTQYAILADGSIIRYTHVNVGPAGISGTCQGVFGTGDALQSVCAEVSVDLNGNKLPNTPGKDLFYFFVTSYGVVPSGGVDITDVNSTFAKCKTMGYGCTTYVLRFGTLDYDKNKF